MSVCSMIMNTLFFQAFCFISIIFIGFFHSLAFFIPCLSLRHVLSICLFGLCGLFACFSGLFFCVKEKGKELLLAWSLSFTYFVFLKLSIWSMKNELKKPLKLRISWHPQCYNYHDDSLKQLPVTALLSAALVGEQKWFRCSSPAGFIRSEHGAPCSAAIPKLL